MSASAELGRLLAVRIGHQLCGIPVERVHDILRPAPITLVPLAPRSVAGSINLRGRIVTVVDLGLRLGVETRTAPAARMSVVVAAGDERYALLVDDVSDVVGTDHAGSGALAVALPPPWADCSAGLCRVRDEGATGASALLVVLDIDRLLTLAEGE